MCGITGIFNLNGEPISVVELKKMTNALAHRGPDSEGFYSDSYLGFGHRRLSIIDLSPAAHQPMISNDGQYVIIYNGEVYNFQELRLELEAKGYHFHSKSDSEVILYAYVEWGPAALERFNGMFAFAIWDRVRQHLFLARDRFGIKPLYYSLQGSAFLFGSEIKALRAHPSFQAVLDQEALLEYFTFQNFFTDRTLFAGVSILPAGTYLTVALGDTEISQPVRYWDYDFSEAAHFKDDREVIEELDRLFRQAVNRQLVSDVEIGSYLSGGMDTGSITAIAAKQLPYLKTFTCGFDLHSAAGIEMGFDEREKAELMSYLFKTEHYEMVLKAGDMERIMPQLVYHLEEPRVGQSYPNFYISQLAGKFLKVVLSGAGGDELFGGYPWRYYRAAVNSSFEDYIDKYYLYWQRLIPNSVLENVFKPIWQNIRHIRTRDIFRDVFKTIPQTLNRPEDYINHSLYFEIKTFLHGLLVVDDKLSMAHSLETRVPFLDNDLVNFAMHLPVRLKLANLDGVVRLNENEPGPKTSQYFNKSKDGKLILRRVMERYVPPEICEGVKQGFSAPDSSWFKGDSMQYVRRLLYNKKARIYDYVDNTAVCNLLDEHLEGRTNRRLLIWSLIYFEVFLQQWF